MMTEPRFLADIQPTELIPVLDKNIFLTFKFVASETAHVMTSETDAIYLKCETAAESFYFKPRTAASHQ